MSGIQCIRGYEVLNSRGDPTVESEYAVESVAPPIRRRLEGRWAQIRFGVTDG